MKTTLFRWTLTMGLVLLAFITTKAQPITPPNPANMEYPYPPPPPPPAVGVTTYNDCYSLPGNWVGGPTIPLWLLVSCWEGPAGLSGFSWQVVDYTTSIIYDQGYHLYPAGVTHLNVGIVHAGPWMNQIDVSYHLNGAGHFVDVWDWPLPVIWGGPGGTTLSSTNQLSCIGIPTAISMDSHIGYGTTIAWEDPANGIDVVAANNNAFGPTFTCNGTIGHVTPDVSFTHTASIPGPPQIHIASYLAGTGIVEYYLNWGDIIPGGVLAMGCPGMLCTPCPAPVTVEDINPVIATPQHIELCSRDHYAVANWAYTYSIGNDVFARILNWNPGGWPSPSFGGIPGTVCFTDGSYSGALYPPGLPVINGVPNNMPTLVWDNPTTGPANFYVVWHTSNNFIPYNPGSDAYIAIQLNEDGTIRNPLFPFAYYGASLTPSNISPSPTVALSRCNDLNPMLYETFSEFNGGSYWMQHRWIPWSSGSFKPGHGASGIGNETEKTISINPNPFKDDLHLDYPTNIEDETIAVKITDMAGRELGIYNNAILGVNTFLSNAAKKLVPGNYIVNVDCKKANMQKSFKVTKAD